MRDEKELPIWNSEVISLPPAESESAPKFPFQLTIFLKEDHQQLGGSLTSGSIQRMEKE